MGQLIAILLFGTFLLIWSWQTAKGAMSGTIRVDYPQPIVVARKKNPQAFWALIVFNLAAMAFAVWYISGVIVRS